jgi:hypothetical protein
MELWLCGSQWWCSACRGFEYLSSGESVVHSHGFELLAWLSIFSGVINGGVVHGRGLESLTFLGQWWCSAWSWVRIFDFFGGQWWCSARSWGRIFDFVVVNVGVVHVVGSNLCLFGGHQWWCSAWSWVRIGLFGVNGGVVHGRGFESLIQTVQSSTPYFTDPYSNYTVSSHQNSISCMDPR